MKKELAIDLLSGQSQEVTMVSYEIKTKTQLKADLETVADVKYMDYLRRKNSSEYMRLLEVMEINRKYNWDGSMKLNQIVQWESPLYFTYKKWLGNTGLTENPVNFKIFVLMHWLRENLNLPTGVLDYDAVLKSLLLEDNGYIAEVTLENPGSRNKT